ncbi:MAG TPA: alpha-glucan family phosphorylase, partial [Burkholderiaceae bacterium]|nr:alpha-glucan family phosphorylase [Burkholderiaceae bacterium]
MYAGDQDLERAIAELESDLPEPLRPLARVAYDYRWSWALDGPATFAAIDLERWMRAACNPMRLLSEAPHPTLARAAANTEFVRRAQRLAVELAAERARPFAAGWLNPAHPVAFLCAEFAVHASLPIYAGGLGVLAGDILKEASDLALPMVGVGLMYRTGYFHQRIDTSGYQHEYWIDTDPERLPCAKVTGDDGRPLTVTVPVDNEDVVAQIWRVDVGRVPLYLLDTDLPCNSQVGRWVTSRLYESNRAIRLAQYAVLGVGGVRALQALGIEPSLHHLNEGHPAPAILELLAREEARGPGTGAWERMREQVVFTTHTPVPAGNEAYAADEFLQALGRVADLVGS